MADILIKLSRSYDHGTEPFDAVVLREPKLKDRRDVGPLYEVQRGLVIWDDTALWAYVTRLQSKPTAPGALDLLDLADADAIEIAVKGFFYGRESALYQADELVFRLGWDAGRVEELTFDGIGWWYDRAIGWHRRQPKRKQ